MKYRTIAADPPWNERGGGKSKRGADKHYPLLKTPEIIDTMADALAMDANATFGGGFSVASNWTHGPESKVADSAHLYLWVTDNFLPDGLRVMAALGFRYVRTWVWVKMDVDEYGDHEFDFDYPSDLPTNFDPHAHLRIGLGQYGRNCHEQILFGVRGETALPPTNMRSPSVFFRDKGRHSEKPQHAYDIMTRTSPGPALEMFARGERDGWDVWGNEV